MADRITVALSGRVDSNNAQRVEDEIRAQLGTASGSPVALDAERLEYISSAGLRVILRLKKTCPDLSLINVSSEVYEILDMTGFTEILNVEKAYKVISVKGCEVIGEGANGKVYRIGQDNVVKTYKNADALAEIQHEREVARLALVLGVPTAISYDVVRVGDSYGSVFELLNAKSFAKIIAEEPERFDWCVREYADLLRRLHGTEVPEGKLPDIKQYYLDAVKKIYALLPAEYSEKLTRLVSEIPERGTMVHGDYHTKNIVLADGEVLLIDMDTLSVGHPIFELAQMYNSYIGFGEREPELIARFQGFSAETARRFWRRSLSAYLGTEDEAVINHIEDKVRCVAYVRLLSWSGRHLDLDDPGDSATFELWRGELLELLDRLDSLDFDPQLEEAHGYQELELDAVTDNLPAVQSFVEDILSAAQCPLKAQMQISIAVEEIFVNICSYAYAPATGRAKIRLELEDSPRAAKITFFDSGAPYNPLAKEDPDVTLSAEERGIGGLGIFMTKKTMDGMSYRYQDSQNILTLKKIF